MRAMRTESWVVACRSLRHSGLIASLSCHSLIHSLHFEVLKQLDSQAEEEEEEEGEEEEEEDYKL